jgi:hypothetical protein
LQSPIKKYSEEILRHLAVRADGSPCEILERLTWEMQASEGASTQTRTLFNRRFDLKTGERVNRLNDNEFEIDGEGLRLRLQR